MWFVYIVRCADDTLYTGVTTNIEKRLREHNGEVKGGARYTLAKRPVSIVYLESAASRSAAQKREAAIKKLSHDQKERLSTI